MSSIFMFVAIFDAVAAAWQAAVKSAQDDAKAKADAVIKDIKAAPATLQKEATKAGETAIGEVSFPEGILTELLAGEQVFWGGEGLPPRAVLDLNRS